MAPVAFFQFLLEQSPLLLFCELTRRGRIARRRLATACGRRIAARAGRRFVIGFRLVHTAGSLHSRLFEAKFQSLLGHSFQNRSVHDLGAPASRRQERATRQRDAGAPRFRALRAREDRVDLRRENVQAAFVPHDVICFCDLLVDRKLRGNALSSLFSRPAALK